VANKVSMGPSGGETFTVTCFTCGMPSSKEWAQRVRSRPSPSSPGEPFFPFLLEGPSAPPQGALLLEDGSTFLCAFCHALLESQWTNNNQGGSHQPHRHYNVAKFICAVCGVETYRKRVRALPFQVS
jgi:ribosomal protein L37E